MKFTEFGLRTEILSSLTALGFEDATPIQDKAIPHILSSKQDVLAFAQTGTGKTAAFSLPLLHHINTKNGQTQAIILCPTRELCLQISKDIERFSTHITGLRIAAIYGGASIEKQLYELRKGVHIVVGTPGRVIDMIERKALKLGNIEWLVLDEADEMLNMGFKEDIDTILAETPKEKQTLLFSATMSSSVERIAKTYMNNPCEIKVAQKNQGSDNVEHIYYMVNARDRFDLLKRLVDVHPDMYGIIFCRTKHETTEISSKLSAHGYAVEAIHGDLSQSQREQVLLRFRQKQTQLLVATDVAARGIDVKELTHVINYSLPDQLESYTHRSGRTGRAHSKGISIAIIHSKEKGRIRAIERQINKQFTEGRIPTGKEVCTAQLFHLLDNISQAEIKESAMEEYLPAIYEKFEHLDRDQLIKKFVAIEFNRFLSLYQHAPDLSASQKGGESDREPRERTRTAKEFTTFTINFGKQDLFTVKELFGLVNRQKSIRGAEIGNIAIRDQKTTFEIDSTFAQSVLVYFNQSHCMGKKVVAEKTEGGASYDQDAYAQPRKKERSFGKRSQSGGRKDRPYRQDRQGGNGRKRRYT